MAENLEIILEMADAQLKREVLTCLEKMPGVAARDGERRKTVRQDSARQLFILNPPADPAGLFQKINALRQQLPQVGIIVISADKRPEFIVEVMKVGADEFLSNPLSLERLQDVVGRIRERLFELVTQGRGRLYSFISAKGGLGSTVVSVNTAAALAMKSKQRVALLDMSLQSGDSSVYLDTLPKTTLADVCKNFHRLDFSFLKTSMQQHATGLHYLAAPKEPEESGMVHGAQIKKILQLAKRLYEHVVVDCTSMLVDECSLETFKASEQIFLITELSVPSVRNAARLNQLLLKLGIPAQKIEIIVNRYTKGGASLPDVEKSLKKKIFWLFPNDFDDVIGSINGGVPLVKSNPGTPFARNVFEFTEKLKNPLSSTPYRGVRGFLGKKI
jgi:pilus assembly protein CpaE